MPNNTLSLNKIISIFNDFQIREKMLNDFGFGTSDQIGASRELLFPFMWVELISTQYTDNMLSEVYTFEISFMDKVMNGQENYSEVLSDQQYIYRQFVGELNRHPYYVDMGLSLLNSAVSAIPVYLAMDENVNGFTVTIQLKEPIRISYCNSPIVPITDYVTVLNNNTNEYRLQGSQGPQGDKGDKGDKGDTGLTGATGSQGPQGDRGYQGATGSTGADSTIPGPQGATGPQGFQGPQGQVGLSSSVAGPQGATGPQGFQGATGNAGPVGATVGTIGISLNGNGAYISTGSKGYINMPYACTITGWQIVSSSTGSIVIDVKKSDYATFPTTTSIAGTELPTLTNQQKNQDLALFTWTTTVAQNDVLEFVVNSNTNITNASLNIRVLK